MVTVRLRRESGPSVIVEIHVDAAAALGGSESDFAADTVTVDGTAGDDSIAATANSAAIDVSGLSAFVEISHADVRADTLVIDSKGATTTCRSTPPWPG